MPKYFFQVHDGQTLPDTQGTDLPDFTAAKVMAVKFAGELLQDHAETFWTIGEWSIEVTDDTGLTLFTLFFTAVEAPTVRRRG